MTDFPAIPITEKSLVLRISWLDQQKQRLAPLVKLMSIRNTQPEAIKALLDSVQASADDNERRLCELDPESPVLKSSYIRYQSVMKAMESYKNVLTNIDDEVETCLKELAVRRGQLDDLRKTQDEAKRKQPKY